jgi:alpha-tubulin suppressor-like RCC1 family protein
MRSRPVGAGKKYSSEAQQPSDLGNGGEDRRALDNATDNLISSMLMEGPPHFEGSTSFLERQLVLVQRAHENLLEEYQPNSGSLTPSLKHDRKSDAGGTIVSGGSLSSLNNKLDGEDSNISQIPSVVSLEIKDEETPYLPTDGMGGGSLQDPSLDEDVPISDDETEEKEASKTDTTREEDDLLITRNELPGAPLIENSIEGSRAGREASLSVESSTMLFGNKDQNTYNRRENYLRTIVPGPMDHLPTNAQIGIRLFFRLLRTLRFDENPRVLNKVVQQIPLLLSNMPPLALSEGLDSFENVNIAGADSKTTVGVVGRRKKTSEVQKRHGRAENGRSENPCTSNLGVVDALSFALENAIIGYKAVPSEKRDESQKIMDGMPDRKIQALSSIVGLAIKRGSLTHIMKSVILLLDSLRDAADIKDQKPPRDTCLPVEQYLQELANANIMEMETPIEFGNAKGRLMAFGKGDHGKLGLGKCTHSHCTDGNCTENKSTPTVIGTLKDVRVTLIDSLSTHSVAVTEDGSLYTWGNGDKHRLGHGTTGKEYAPRLVMSLRDKPAVVDVACGLGHTLVLLVTGQVYSWGNGGNGRLGHGDTQDRATACLVGVLEGMNVTSLYSGASHSLAISEEGACISWGKNNQGQCGHGNMTDHLFPMVIEYFQGKGDVISQVAGGWEHTLASTRDGRIFSFGSGYKDSRRAGLPPVLGHGGNEHQLLPCQIVSLSEENIVHIACGWDHSLAVSTEGLLYTWGAGTNGKLGHGDESDRAIPTCVEAVRGKMIVQAEAGCEHSAAVTSDGELLTWGHGDSGRLGHGENKSENKPRRVVFEKNESLRVVSIAVGDKYNMILVKDVDEKNVQDGHVNKGEVEGDTNMAKSSLAWEAGAHSPPASKFTKNPGGVTKAGADMTSAWILNRNLFSVELEDVRIVSDRKVPLISAYKLPVLILAHLERLAQPFLGSTYINRGDCAAAVNSSFRGPNNVNVAMSLAIKNQLAQKKIGAKEESSLVGGDDADIVPKFAYCIEPNEEALVLFHAILLRCVQENTNEDVDKNDNAVHFCRWCVVWCTLRLLKANLQQLLSWAMVDEPGHISLGNKASAESPVGNRLGIKMRSVFKMIHTLLLRIIKEPLQFSYYAGLGSKPDSKGGAGKISASDSRVLIEREAGDVVRVGFDFFYPTPASRKHVLGQFMSEERPNMILLNAIMDRLSQNFVVSRLIRSVLPASMPEGNDTNAATGTLDRQGVNDLLQDLLSRASNEVIDRLHGQAKNQQMHSGSYGPRSLPYTRLLLALQNHILAAWGHIMKIKGPSTSRISGETHSCVLSHGHRLLEKAAECLCVCLTVLSKDQSKDALGSAREVFLNSFLAAILMPFIGALCIVPPHPSVATSLLPPLLKLVKAVDSVNALMGSQFKGSWIIDHGNVKAGADEIVPWEVRLHAMLACFAGQLIAVVTKGTPLAPREKAFKRWLCSKLLSGGLLSETDGRSDANMAEDDQGGHNDLDVVISWHRRGVYSTGKSPQENLGEEYGRDKSQESFLRKLIDGEGEPQQLDSWVQNTILGRSAPNSPSMAAKSSPKKDSACPPELAAGKNSLRALVAVILKFNGYVTEAMSQSQILCMSRGRLAANETPSDTLVYVWSTALRLQRLVAMTQGIPESQGVQQRARAAALAATVNNVLPTSPSVARSVVRNCSFLLRVNPAFPIQLLEESDRSRRYDSGETMEFTKVDKQGQIISLEEVFDFVSRPLDTSLLYFEMVKRKQRSRIRAIGLDLTRYLLGIISPQFGYVRAQAIAQVPFSMTRFSREVASTPHVPNGNTSPQHKDAPISIGNGTKADQMVPQAFHYMLDLQSCGGHTANFVHSAFVELYQELANLLIDQKSTHSFKLALLHSWTLKLQSPDHLRHSRFVAVEAASPKHQKRTEESEGRDAFGGGLLLALAEDGARNEQNKSIVHLCSRILSILGEMLCTEGDLLLKQSEEYALTSSSALHHSAWRIFFLLGIQLCTSDEDLLGNEMHRKDSRSHPLYTVLVEELGRVQNVLSEISDLELNFVKASQRSGLRVIMPGKLWMTRDQPGTVVPDSGSPKDLQNGSFALSFWIRVPKRRDNEGSSHSGGKVTRRVVCIRAHEVVSSKASSEKQFSYYPGVFLVYDNEIEGKKTTRARVVVVLTTSVDGKLVHNSLVSPVHLRVGTWSHVVCSYNDSKEIRLYLDGQLAGKLKTEGMLIWSGSRPLHIGAPKISAFPEAAEASSKWGADSGFLGWLSDLWYHDEGVDPDDIPYLSKVPSPSEIRLKSDADNYCYRLVTMALELVRTHKGLAGLIENDKCVAVMLSLLRYSSGKVQRSILQFLEEILPHISPLGVHVPLMNSMAGSGMAAAKANRGINGLWTYFAHLVGVAWFCNENGSLELSGSVNSVLAQFLPSSLTAEKYVSSDAVMNAPGRTGAIAQRHMTMSDRSALISGIVRLLRQLLQSPQWSKQLSDSLTESLSGLSEHVQDVLLGTTERVDKRSIMWAKHRTLLVNGVCAVYVLGGLIEQPHVGAKVYFPTPQNTAIDFIGSTISGESQAVGLVVRIDWKTRSAIVVACNSLRSASVSVPLNLLKVVYKQHDFIVNDDILTPLISMAKVFLGLTKTGSENVCDSADHHASFSTQLPWVNRVTNKPSVGIDGEIVTETNSVMCLIRARCLCALSALCANASSAKRILASGMLPSLLRVAVSNVSSAADVVSSQGAMTQARKAKQKSLGFSFPITDAESNSSSNVYTSAANLSSKLSIWVGVPSLEQLGEEAWSRLHSAPPPLPSSDLKRRPRIDILGGEIAIEQKKYRAESTSNFPSIRLGNISLFPLHSVGNLGSQNNLIDSYPPGALVGGRWYYEAVLLSDGLMQIGWADALYKGDPERGQGVGDHPHSWAIDGYRCKKWNSSSADYGERWHVADVIGCSIDLDSLQMRFSLNGKDLGVAFTSFHAVGGCYPAASFNMQQSARFNFGPPHSQFAFPPPSGYKCVSAAINEGVNAQEQAANKPISKQPDNTDRTEKEQTFSAPIPSVDHSASGIALRRQALVDNLISMGFPIDWCIRAANVQRSTVMDESRAIAWIIEKMEFENLTSVEEESAGESSTTRLAAFMENTATIGYLSQARNGDDETQYPFMDVNVSDQELLQRIRESQQSSDDDEDDDEDDDDDEEDEEEDEEDIDTGEGDREESLKDTAPGNRAEEPSAANRSFGSVSRRSQSATVQSLAGRQRAEVLLDENLLGDEECNEIYAPVVERYFASPLLGRQGLSFGSSVSTANGTVNMLPGIESAALMSVVGGVANTSPTLSQANRPGNGNDAYSSSAILAEIFAGLSVPGDVGNSISSGGNMIQRIASNDDCQELWGLSVATSCALSTIYARATILSILRHASDTDGGEGESVASQLGDIISSPQCVLMFVDFLKLVRFRGPLPHHSSGAAALTPRKDFCDELDHLLRPTFSLLLKKSRVFLNEESLKEKEPGQNTDRSGSPLFLTVLVDEALSHFTRASSREYDRMLWISRPAPPIHPYSSSVLTLTCDSDALVQPNPVWSTWTLNTLMDELEAYSREKSSEQGLLTPAVESDIFGIGVLATLLRAAHTPNLALKDILFRLIGRIVHHCATSYPGAGPSSTQELIRWHHNASIVLKTVREQRLAQVLTSRFRKEHDQTIIYSSYLQTLASVLVCCTQVRSLMKKCVVFTGQNFSSAQTVSATGPRAETNADSDAGANDEKIALLQPIPEIVVDDIGINSVSLAWWLSTDDIAKSIENKQKFIVRVSYAEVPQPWLIDVPASIHSGDTHKYLEFKRVTPQQATPVMDYGGFGTRPKTLSTIVCGDLSADSQYAFRLELDIMKIGDAGPDGDYESLADLHGSNTGEDGSYLVRTLLGKPVYLDTRSETLFILDPNSCGPNLVLSNNNLSVTNTVNKKWNAIRASACFSSGVHYWEVHIDKCVSKNIFVGVMSEGGSTDNYVGSDREGWGYLANKAIWHNKGKMCTYGELFREGDRIGVSLDMDCGTIAFSRNGKDLGVAVEGLTGDLYPAFSLYNLDDQVSLIPSPVTHGKHSGNSDRTDGHAKRSVQMNAGSMARRIIDNLYRTTAGLNALASGTPDRSLVPKEEVLDFMKKAKKSHLCRYKTVDGDALLLDISIEACRPFGFVAGEIVLTPKGEVNIVGECKGMLWWKAVGDTTVSSWSRKTCRELRLALGPKPVQTHGEIVGGMRARNDTVNDEPLQNGDIFSTLMDDSDVDLESLVEKMVNEAEEPWQVDFKNIEGQYKSVAALIYLLNHKLENVLPLVEIWRDGYSLSSSGMSPRAGLDGLMTSAPPLSWTCGSHLLNARKLVFPWTKIALFRALINHTSAQGPSTKIRLTLSRGNLDLESVFRQLRLVASAELRCGVQFVIGHPGENAHHEQSACFDLICDAMNQATIAVSNHDLVGELVGIGLRMGHRFCLELPGSTWEAICNPVTDMRDGAEIRLGLLQIVPGHILPLFTGKELKILCWEGKP